MEEDKYRSIEEKSRDIFTKLVMVNKLSVELQNNHQMQYNHFFKFSSIATKALFVLLCFVFGKDKFMEAVSSIQDGIAGISDQLHSVQESKKEEKGKGYGETIYEWSAWAVSPLKKCKFW